MAIILGGQLKGYKVPEDLSEIKLGRFLTIVRDVETVEPQLLGSLLQAETPEERAEILSGIDNAKYSHKFLPYYAKFVSVICDIPEAILIGQGDGPRLHWQDLEKLFWMIQEVFLKFRYDPEWTSVEIEGVEYVLPDRFMENSTVIEFMESAQLQKQMADVTGGNWLALPKLMAVLLRPKGEVYDDKKLESRARLFERELGMDVALNIGFFLLKRSKELKTDTLSFMMARRLAKSKQGSTI